MKLPHGRIEIQAGHIRSCQGLLKDASTACRRLAQQPAVAARLRLLAFAAGVLCMALLGGCATARKTDTARTGAEQLLISNAIDHALGNIDFRPLEGQSVYIDEKYIESVDKTYVISSIRHRMFRAGVTVVAKPEDAETIVEVRSGGIGTDGSDTFVGIPSVTIPPMISLPELRLFTKTTQTGTAKIGLVAYDAKTRQSLGEGGVTRARSVDSNWFALGFGPYKTGSIKDEVQATKNENDFPLEVVAGKPHAREHAGDIQQAVFIPRSNSGEPARLQGPLDEVIPTAR